MPGRDLNFPSRSRKARRMFNSCANAADPTRRPGSNWIRWCWRETEGREKEDRKIIDRKICFRFPREKKKRFGSSSFLLHFSVFSRLSEPKEICAACGYFEALVRLDTNPNSMRVLLAPGLY